MDKSGDDQLGSIISSSTCDLIDAKLEEHHFCGSNSCPGCGHNLQRKPDWVGLPAGVKFDPTDQELIEHLEAKVEARDSKSHPLIDEFIPTIEGEDGICYTHPENLPGVTRDGLSRHFFHRPSKAYTTGTRKRRKIQTECDHLQGRETRWHKTGKTRLVLVNGKPNGCKKILVLYTNFGKNRKPEKTNWVMHQYHLGQHEEEKDGEVVVSKIFYQTQPRQCNSTVAGEGREGSNSSEYNSRIRSFPNSKKILIQKDQLSVADAVISSSHYNPMDHFSFTPFKKRFDEVGRIAEASIRRGALATGTCDDGDLDELQRRPCHDLTLHKHSQDLQQHQQQQIATTAFHISRPSHLSISSIVLPPSPLHHSSIILNEECFQASRMMLQNENFQVTKQAELILSEWETWLKNCLLPRCKQQQQHHKVGERSLSGLEALIMSDTSSTSDTKESSSITYPWEAEWLKYFTVWPYPDVDPDSDDPDHHV